MAPEKPWFTYLAPGCGHAPHHVFKEWIERYQGRFDEGYEAIRGSILERQKEMGLLPADTQLTTINPHGEPNAVGPNGQPWPSLDYVHPWDDLDEDTRKLFIRMAEVYAGFVSYTDHEIGRVLDYLEESGQLENTIVIVVSDNGSSAEGGPNGSFNENKFFNGIPDTVESNLAFLNDLGTPRACNHYTSGWAWAFDTPFPYWKRYAGYEGGTADLCLIAWPQGIGARGEIRDQYLHAVDLVPTIYDMIGIEPPDEINGWTQSPIEGQSMKATFDDPSAQGRTDQFYSMLGQRAMYVDGWLANTVHPTISGWGSFDDDEWELFHLAEDRSQSKNLAEEEPRRLRSLIERWWRDAGALNGLPIDDRSAREVLGSERPQPGKPQNRYRYYPGVAPVPEAVAVNIRGRSYTIAAGIVVEKADPAGVLFSQGTLLGGHQLSIVDGELRYTYNWLGEDVQRVSAPLALSPGRHLLSAEFAVTGRDEATPSPAGTLTLYVDEEQVAQGEIRTQPGKFGLGSGLAVGRALAPAPDPDLAAPATFTGGSIEAVIVDVSGDSYIDHETEVAAWLAHD